jgi:hypothetical protein
MRLGLTALLAAVLLTLAVLLLGRGLDPGITLGMLAGLCFMLGRDSKP